MASTRRPARRIKEALLAVLIGLLLFAGLLRLERPMHREALIRDAIASHLVEGETAGRQALVGSVWWAPLPSLLLVPLGYTTRMLPGGSAALLFAAILAGVVLWALYRFGRIRLSRIESAYLAVAFMIMPGMADSVAYGVGYYWHLLLTIALLTAYHGWRREHSLRALVLFGSAGGLIAISGPALLGWAVLVVGLLGAHELARRAPGAETRATLLLAVLPGVYTAGLWILMNWLIMADPLHFLRTWPMAMEQGGMEAGLEALSTPGIGVISVYLLLIAVIAAIAGCGAACCMAAAALLWLAPIYLFGHIDLPEMRIGAGLSMALGALVATAVLAGSIKQHRARLRLALCLMPLALAVALRTPTFSLPPELRARIDAPVERHALLQGVRTHVTRLGQPHVRIFAAGFEGLHLLSGWDDPAFEPVLDFDFEQAAIDYPGYRLYLLVHRPEDAAALDGIHAKYPGIYRRGGPRSLYDSDWDAWRLFEVSGIELPLEYQ